MSSSQTSTSSIPTTEEECQTTTAITTIRSRYFRHKLTPPEFELDPHTVKVVWRDLCFLALGCVAVSIIGFVESHASEVDARSIAVQVAGIYDMGERPLNPHGIVDTGFILTHPLYEFLKQNRDWNDLLAGINSLILVGPTLYIAYVTAWRGDYSLPFRVIALQLLRAFCGWFTYLPPDPTYLNSYYDFPDIIFCLFEDCHSTTAVPEAMPFVSFFSGHVATMVVVGNHMWLNGWKNFAIAIHFANAFQIIRLLATRGHYSIDMIIGWYVAVYVTNPAGRLGRYYSRGARMEDFLPQTPQEAFETITGMHDARNETRLSLLMRNPEVQEALKKLEEEGAGYFEQNDTTANIIQKQASKMVQEKAGHLQEHRNRIQEQASEMMQKRAEILQNQIKYLQKKAALLILGTHHIKEDNLTSNHENIKNRKGSQSQQHENLAGKDEEVDSADEALCEMLGLSTISGLAVEEKVDDENDIDNDLVAANGSTSFDPSKAVSATLLDKCIGLDKVYLEESIFTFPSEISIPSSHMRMLTEELVWDQRISADRTYETISVFKNGEITKRRVLTRFENFVDSHQGWSQLCHGYLRQCLSAALGVEMTLFKEKLNLKPPGGSGFAPHLDGPSLRIALGDDGPKTFCTVMVAIDDMTSKNGCLRICRGQWSSQNCTNVIEPEKDGNPDAGGRAGAIPVEIAEALPFEDLECKGGTIVCFGDYMPHRSAANSSPFPRRAVFLTYNPVSEGSFRDAYYKHMEAKRNAWRQNVGLAANSVEDEQIELQALATIPKI